jgi:hypothetical protein
MTVRILWIELRRSAFWATLAAIALGLFGFTPAIGEGTAGLVAAQREGLAFLVPLALAIGAIRARRDRRSRLPELLATTARPRWQRLLLTAAALAVGAITGYTVMFAGVVGYAAAIGAYVPVGSLSGAAATAACLAAAFWLGLAAGRALPYAFVPPLLVVFGFVAMTLLVLFGDLEGYGDRPPPGTVLLNPTQLEGFEAFETLSGRAQLAQAAWMVALAAACLLLFVATRYARLAAVLPVALGLAVALPLLPDNATDAILLDRDALALECTAEEPRVCVRRVHAGLLGELRDPGGEALALLAAKLPQAPTTVVEVASEDLPDLPYLPPDPDILYADVRADGGQLAGTDRDVSWNLLNGAGTPLCDNVATGAQANRHAAARLIAAAWLLGEQPQAAAGEWSWVSELPETASAYQTFAALPADEQRVRVAALREAELACAGRDVLDILVGDVR